MTCLFPLWNWTRIKFSITFASSRIVYQYERTVRLLSRCQERTRKLECQKSVLPMFFPQISFKWITRSGSFESIHPCVQRNGMICVYHPSSTKPARFITRIDRMFKCHVAQNRSSFQG